MGAVACSTQFLFVQGEGLLGLFPKYPPCVARCTLSLDAGDLGGLYLLRDPKTTERYLGPCKGAATARFGFVRAWQDRSAPVIKVVSVKHTAMSFRVSDSGTGVARVSLYLDGEWVPGDYDPDEGSYVFKPLSRLLASEYTWRLVVTDGAGNSSEQSGTLKGK